MDESEVPEEKQGTVLLQNRATMHLIMQILRMEMRAANKCEKDAVGINVLGSGSAREWRLPDMLYTD